MEAYIVAGYAPVTKSKEAGFFTGPTTGHLVIGLLPRFPNWIPNKWMM
jgi:hypothetical protein